MPKLKANAASSASDNFIIAVGCAVLLVTLHFLDDPANPLRWHAAIVWTILAFMTLALMRRFIHQSWRFWLFWLVALAVHITAMWYIFGVLFPAILIGTLYTSGLGIVEGFFLGVLFLWLAPARDKRRGRPGPGRSHGQAAAETDK